MIDVDTLVAYAEELEDAETGSGRSWLVGRRAEALAKINGGGSSDYISTTVNGQTFERRIEGTASDWFAVLTQAIKQLAGTSVKVTYARVTNPPH
jgi:hypothetical protein